ncbi:MAG: hypothetical protein STSR0009_09910 [Methanoregula sp.]|jgi:amino acid transporter
MSKFCNQCGSEINSDALFCDKCGKKCSTGSGSQTAGKSVTVEFILGLIGGIIGFFAGVAAIGIGALGSAFSAQGASSLIGLGIGAIIFSIIGIVGAAIVKSNTKNAGYLMIISAIGGLICISAFYILSFILLIIGGVMAVRHKE